MRRRALLAAGTSGMVTAAGSGAAQVAPTPMRRREWEMLAGGETERPYRIYFAEPGTPPPAGGFPLFLLLDGDGHFEPAVAALEAHGGSAAIAAIGYPGRNRRELDYTVPAEPPIPEEGGAPAFLAFVRDELLPRLAQEARLDPADRSLFGHSYGGLFVLYTLFRQPGLFRAHVAASPSIGYGQGTILPLEAGFEAAPPEVAPRLRLLVTVGELEQPRPPAPISERARIARQVDRARDLVERLSQLGPAGPRVAFHLFPGETHQSVVDPAIRLGLDFVLQR
ncbi:IroE protein [Roseomonas mucosa]|uniref:alpha/beta hydrolase n=1 Tax=Roseomonas TaxID=125216 RepID=UPI00096750B8|nr:MULTISPECIES: alpha/beta hydrolase-fold protein [Roseomonas]ATR21102.1 hypothetical protein CTJ15_12845 [Roseomonas sp. FDAARGOS_362]MDT8263099.1 alpha/beta hydrolase-fold protein [Roseomonas sp. DSM 102946]UZO96581.1 IroE protein [Roseomonas mucosa]GAV36607.1 ferri-bacillibactin esterase BesA [Roseomonas sp. TAS13]